MKILHNIPIKIEVEEVFRNLRLGNSNYLTKMNISTKKLLEQTISVVKPKALYEVSYIDNIDGDAIHIDGIKFTSRILRTNLEHLKRVFPYIVTCGNELENVDTPSMSILQSHIRDEIKNMILRSARNFLKDHLINTFRLGQLSRMSPGELEDWPITQQIELFSIFGENVSKIDVKLTKDCLMIPIKTVSGIYFPTEISFESCQLCPRQNCIGRRASYDPSVAKKYGITM